MSSHELFRPTRIPLLGTPVKSPSAQQIDALPGIQMPAYRPQPSDNSTCSPTKEEESKHSPSSRKLDVLPTFQRHEESTNIELFYDLFFVANLTTFSALHEINDKKTLTCYIGFFCVLWFTWCQVTMFDVRFGADSVVDRVATAVHLGVMVGFAVVGPNFFPSDYDKEVFKTMSLILMVSRFVLAFQYLLLVWHTRKYRNTKLPFILIAASDFIAACIYLGVTFSFGNKRSYGYRSFYAIAVVEIAFNIAVSAHWKVVSFKGTHLTQRMSLLTLIILGEGVMVVCENISTIVTNQNAWTGATIGTITAAIATIYFLYMLYFDALPRHHFGSIRQEIWAFLHFPYHLALVLFMEGMAQFVLWHKMVEVSGYFLTQANAPEMQHLYETNSSLLASTLRADITEIFLSYPPTNPKTYAEVNSTLSTIALGYDPENATSVDSFQDVVDDLLSAVIHSIFTSYGFEPPAPRAGKHDDRTPQQELAADVGVIGLVFIYFFIAAGVTLMLMGLINVLTLPRQQFTSGIRHPAILIRLGAYVFVGLGLALLSIMESFHVGTTLASSAWMLPLVAFCVLVVLGVQYVYWPEFGKKARNGFAKVRLPILRRGRRK